MTAIRDLALVVPIEPQGKVQSLCAIKIAFLIGSLARGGAEGQLLELLQRLDRSRWRPSLVLFDDSYRDRVSGFEEQIFSLDIPASGLSRSYAKGFRVAGAITRLTRYLRRVRPDVVHAFLPASFVLAVPATKMAGVPVLVGSRRSLAAAYRLPSISGRVDLIATRMCDFLIGNSNAVTEDLVRDGVASERTATIYNGVNTGRFRPGDRSFRALHGWTEEHIVFGIVANFLLYKRHVDFIRAAAQIAENAPNARFVMAGEDRGILPELRRQIASSGLESRFVVVPGTSEPEKLYPAMDAYICTSETEGFSNVLLEAAASGLPLIATNVGGNPEIVFPRDNGFLIPVGAHEEAARAALALIDNRDLRLQMGARSRQIVSQNFSLEKMVQQHEQLYERLLAQRGNPLAGPYGVRQRK